MARKDDPLKNSIQKAPVEDLTSSSSKPPTAADTSPAKTKRTTTKKSAQSRDGGAGAKRAGAVEKATPKRTPTTTASAGIPEAEIAMHAYLIYEQRRQLGTPGDHHSDWAQAERELSDALKVTRARQQKAGPAPTP